MPNKKYGIYKITNTITNESYIGKSTNIEKRFESHKQDLKDGTHHNKGLQEDFNLAKSLNPDFEIFTYDVIKEIQEYIPNDINAESLFDDSDMQFEDIKPNEKILSDEFLSKIGLAQNFWAYNDLKENWKDAEDNLTRDVFESKLDEVKEKYHDDSLVYLDYFMITLLILFRKNYLENITIVMDVKGNHENRKNGSVPSKEIQLINDDVLSNSFNKKANILKKSKSSIAKM